MEHKTIRGIPNKKYINPDVNNSSKIVKNIVSILITSFVFAII